MASVRRFPHALASLRPARATPLQRLHPGGADGGVCHFGAGDGAGARFAGAHVRDGAIPQRGARHRH